MGQVLGWLAISVWLTVGAAIAVAVLLQGNMNSLHGMVERTKVAMNWVSPLFQAVLMLCLVNAGMMAVYIPLIPLMIYIFATMGWLMTVIEAMIAGPLVAMGITYPKGHDILGKSEQAMMMLIGVFLRPALITLGFFASVLFVRIAYDMFLGTVREYVTLMLGSSAYVGNLVIAMAFMVVYTIIIIGVIETAFSLINVIPERVMHWIGVQGMAQDLGSFHNANGPKWL